MFCIKCLYNSHNKLKRYFNDVNYMSKCQLCYGSVTFFERQVDNSEVKFNYKNNYWMEFKITLVIMRDGLCCE